jgi:ATP-dependent DNA ligase
MKIGWKPQKGKAFDKLPAKTLELFDNIRYLVSTKYDGHQIFISKIRGVVRFFTSDWKEFNLPKMNYYISSLPGDNFTLVGEFNYDSEGKLGDRSKSAVLTTFRTNFKKGIKTSPGQEDRCVVKVFDFVEVGLYLYADRLERARNLLYTALPMNISVVHTVIMSGREAFKYKDELTANGWEGCMLVEPDTYYEFSRRVNHSIKLKNRPTVDLLCIGVEYGQGKYANQIGAIVLKDSIGRTALAGSGLSDLQRLQAPKYFIDKVWEISYEQIMDTYIQPVIVSLREDKEID